MYIFYQKHQYFFKRGFTLVELLIAISILAIVSAVGFSVFSQSQVRGRDYKRKQDLRAVATALEIYRHKNGRYPCGGWQQSTTDGWTINDTVTSLPPCDTPAELIEPLNSSYISVLPKDPLESGGNPWDESNDGYHYGVFSECSAKADYYVLVAQLENKNDPERIELNNPKWCDGTTLLYPDSGFLSPSSFVITSP